MTTNARTDPESGLRFYVWKERDLPSVTSIRRLIGMPFTLHNWTQSKIIDRAIADHDKIGEMLARPRKPRERVRDRNVLKEVKSYLRSAATEERDLAGDRGTRAHEAIANGLAPADVPADIFGHVVQFHDFMATTGARILWSERQVWNLTYGYAGTGDALILKDGFTVMTDYKTSKGVYIDHAVQLMAYSMGEFVGENDKVDAGASQLLHKADKMAVLHLSEHEWEWIEIRPLPSLFQAFVGSLAFATFLHAHDNNIDSLVAYRQKGGTLVPALAKGLRLIEGDQHDGPG